MIEFRNVSVVYPQGEMPAVEGLTVSFADGESVGLVGANGAGKSTLMRAVLGLIPHRGEIVVEGVTLCEKTVQEVRRKVGFVLQDSESQMFMPTVLEDMMFGLLMAGASREEAERRADKVLNGLGMEGLKNRANHRISGGEKRMAAIATVLAMEPKALFLDEPTSALDPANRRVVIRALQGMTQTKLIATHDLDLVLEVCPRVLVLSGGRLVADGPAEEVLSDAALLEANRLELPLSRQGARRG